MLLFNFPQPNTAEPILWRRKPRGGGIDEGQRVVATKRPVELTETMMADAQWSSLPPRGTFHMFHTYK